MLRIQIADTGIVAMCNELLYDDVNHYMARPLAMSVVGSEQAVRAIRAACCLGDDRRPCLEIGGLSLQWTGKSKVSTCLLAPGVTHMIVVNQRDQDDPDGERVVFTHGQDFAECFYRALLTHRSTPIMPIDSQDPVERELVKTWIRRLVPMIRKNPQYWRAAKTPAGVDGTWAGGLLRIKSSDLDQIASTLVAGESLPLQLESVR